MQEQQKSVVETDSKSSKIIDPGAPRGDAPSGAKRRATTLMSRTILVKPGPALAAEGSEKAGLLVAEFCAHISMRAPQRSLNTTQRFQRRKSFPIASDPVRSLFFHHYDWNRWFASLATTVDNTIKMADRSFKHGRQ